MTIAIELNGVTHSLAEDHTIAALVHSLNLTNQSLAVAVNREIVPRQVWAERVLQARDRVDIVKAIGGG